MCGGSSTTSKQVNTLNNLNLPNGDIFPLNEYRQALLIANTDDLPNALNDIMAHMCMLIRWRVPLSQIWLLIDSSSDSRGRLDVLTNMRIGGQQINIVTNNGHNFETKYNETISNIVSQASGRSSSLYVVLSGHGGQIRDNGNDEADGYDEIIAPAGIYVRDDILYNGLHLLTQNYNVLALADTCSSGSMFDIDRKGLSADIVSIGACADQEVSYEVVCRTTNMISFLTSQSFNNVDQFISKLASPFITGSLTAAFIDNCFKPTGPSIVTGIDIRNIFLDLESINQSGIYQSSRALSQPSPWNPLLWVLLILLIIIVIIILIWLIVKTTNDSKNTMSLK